VVQAPRRIDSFGKPFREMSDHEQFEYVLGYYVHEHRSRDKKTTIHLNKLILAADPNPKIMHYVIHQRTGFKLINEDGLLKHLTEFETLYANWKELEHLALPFLSKKKTENIPIEHSDIIRCKIRMRGKMVLDGKDSDIFDSEMKKFFTNSSRFYLDKRDLKACLEPFTLPNFDLEQWAIACISNDIDIPRKRNGGMRLEANFWDTSRVTSKVGAKYVQSFGYEYFEEIIKSINLDRKIIFDIISNSTCNYRIWNGWLDTIQINEMERFFEIIPKFLSKFTPGTLSELRKYGMPSPNDQEVVLINKIDSLIKKHSYGLKNEDLNLLLSNLIQFCHVLPTIEKKLMDSYSVVNQSTEYSSIIRESIKWRIRVLHPNMEVFFKDFTYQDYVNLFNCDSSQHRKLAISNYTASLLPNILHQEPNSKIGMKFVLNVLEKLEEDDPYVDFSDKSKVEKLLEVADEFVSRGKSLNSIKSRRKNRLAKIIRAIESRNSWKSILHQHMD
jgi:hypothetical protein